MRAYKAKPSTRDQEGCRQTPQLAPPQAKIGHVKFQPAQSLKYLDGSKIGRCGGHHPPSTDNPQKPYTRSDGYNKGKGPDRRHCGLPHRAGVHFLLWAAETYGNQCPKNLEVDGKSSMHAGRLLV